MMADTQDAEKVDEGLTTAVESKPADNGSSDGSKGEELVLEGTSAPKPAPQGFVAPNGGLAAWSAVAGGFLCQFASFGFLNVLGIFQTQYQEENLSNYSPSTISWIFTFQLFLMFLCAQADGMLVDMFGPRAVMIPSAILELLGIAMLSLSKQNHYYQFFLAQGVCFGIGAAGLFMPGLIVAGQYFTTRRSLAIGIVASGASMGGVIFPFVLNGLFNHVGFAVGLRWVVLILGVPLALAIFLISSPLEPKGWAAGKRSLVGIKVFKKKPFLLFNIGGFLFYWGLFAPFDYLPSFALKVANQNISLYTISIINASSVFGRIFPSFLADKFGALLVMSIMAFLTSITVLLIWLPVNHSEDLFGVMFFTLLYGFTSGAFVSLMTPALVQLCGGKIADLGLMLGTFMAINSFASLTGLPIQGAIVDSQNGNFLGLILFSGISLFVGSTFITSSLFMERYEKKKAAPPVTPGDV
ncbi:hypothetical protein G7Y89_g4162 [Cudoniella acicularis]|uniref:Major facilitator superfamily (MFS) profile domain-containing protein n=1 Tax=Cudoniella acicularis TaxID=354080 RepID=A0A8H4RQT9_9HELO|nr:hypothetical protein G7Y89_g4162 [Cudoniella acicularis]